MHQERYIIDVLKRFGMSDCRAVSTPADCHIRLCKSGAYRVDKGDMYTGLHIARVDKNGRLQGGA